MIRAQLPKMDQATFARLGAVGPTQMQSAWCALLRDSELMPQYQDFGF
jgi:hypothetical protein